jgi:hypothetical protein
MRLVAPDLDAIGLESLRAAYRFNPGSREALDRMVQLVALYNYLVMEGDGY